MTKLILVALLLMFTCINAASESLVGLSEAALQELQKLKDVGVDKSEEEWIWRERLRDAYLLETDDIEKHKIAWQQWHKFLLHRLSEKQRLYNTGVMTYSDLLAIKYEVLFAKKMSLKLDAM